MPRQLGDYVASQHYQVLAPAGPRPQRLISPSLKASGGTPSTEASLAEAVELLTTLPERMIMAWRTAGVFEPREAKAFISPSAAVVVGSLGANATLIASFTMPERHCGYLRAVALSVTPAASADQVNWTIMLNGVPHPFFTNIAFSRSNLLFPHPFSLEITQSKRVELYAYNNTGGNLTCMGILYGWTEFLSESKKYGTVPASGLV